MGSEGRGSPPTLIPFFGQAGDAEGGNQNWRKDKEEKEEEEAAAGALVGEEALCAPTALLSLSRKAPDQGPTESKLELHPLLSR